MDADQVAGREVHVVGMHAAAHVPINAAAGDCRSRPISDAARLIADG